MRPILQRWINDADTARHLQFFSVAQMPIELSRVSNRMDDYYISLVGLLFQNAGIEEVSRSDWAQLGNAFLQFAIETSEDRLRHLGISREDATLFSAASFYFGDYPASACLVMRRARVPAQTHSLRAACFDFLARPSNLTSEIARGVVETLKGGDLQRMDRLLNQYGIAERVALKDGPENWISANLLKRLLARFRVSNLRSVLPNGQEEFWNPLVESLVDRQPSTWEFFPSQIEAIEAGLLSSNLTYSLQMPTGAGKTTLCETLLFWHLRRNPADAAILLVPYRSLASELRTTLVQHLNAFGLASRCAYGGTVPTGDEVHALDNVRAIIATPEALSGLLSADRNFAARVGLVICDEGHLLDGDGRGIGLELLLARLKARQVRHTRFVFMSAIVPNIGEINAWLGGTAETLIESTYRPALAEFSVLRPGGSGANRSIRLEMHPHDPARVFSVGAFLERRDFTYRNVLSGRVNTYDFGSIKAWALASARKVLPMGAVAIFAANKRGAQGAVGIADSLVNQLDVNLPLPKPIDFARQDSVLRTHAYLEEEYGPDWIGCRCVRVGFVLHHGDVPQETREVLETLIRSQDVQLVVCTSTLAEGVNLPIRTLVLYSVQRRGKDGRPINMLERDIKNLVGRAGRAGANTKGLVICANPDQWVFVQPVAAQGVGEPVRGSLLKLIGLLTSFLSTRNLALSNEFLEHNALIHPLIDGIDATLVELLSDEIGEEDFIRLATDLASHTFAAQQLPEAAVVNLRSIFSLRATRLAAFRQEGKAIWARETGARVRLIESVEQRLLPSRPDWHTPVDSLDDNLSQVLFAWAWTHSDVRDEVSQIFHVQDDGNVEEIKNRFFQVAKCWMSGATFRSIAQQVTLPMDDLLAVHTRGITFTLQTVIEQGISLLERCLAAQGVELAQGVKNFPEHLRYGAPTAAARMLAETGVRHRKAYVLLGGALQNGGFAQNPLEVRAAAAASLTEFTDGWRATLGELVFQNALADLVRR